MRLQRRKRTAHASALLRYLFVEHGYKIGKIAIVCEANDEAKFMAFVGAGMRKAPVRCFRLEQFGAAHAWVRE
jgi:hypothetical protein